MDTLTRDGANALARRIFHYWEKQGGSLAVWVEEQTYPAKARLERGETATMFVVRSSMRGGNPR